MEETNCKKRIGFVELWQGSTSLLGLADTGADSNCIGLKLAQRLDCRWVSRKKTRATGLGGVVDGMGTCLIKFCLVTGDEVSQMFVVVKELGMGIILGLPFLGKINAKFRVRDMILETEFGDLELLQGYVVSNANSWIHVVERELVEIEGDKVEEKDESCPDVAKEIQEKLKGSNLTRRELEKTYALLRDFEDIWAGERRGEAVGVCHRIELTTKKSLATRPRRFSTEQQQVIEQEVLEMEKQGVIEDSDSPYASDIVLVRKPTGEWRVCIDFRLVNEYTADDKFPLPSLQDLVRSVKGSRYFVTLDLRAGYWQIMMEKNSKKYTAFRTARGLKHFKVMPFGLKNAPATFQRFMEELLGDLRWDGVLVYLDDILVHGETFEAVNTRLQVVFQRLREANLTLRLQKCEFYRECIKYLGYIVSQGVLKPNPAKVEALRRAKVPDNASELRSLLGLAGFYRQFIPHFAASATPLYRLLKKDVKFVWGTEQDNAMKVLLRGLEEQVLANPGLEEKLKVETDASDIAIGGILSCSRDGTNWRPVEFMSATLNETQQRWPVHEREAWAIIAAVEKFDCYLRGREFVVYTDNSSLQWMAKASTGKIARWAARLAEYKMTVIHRSSSQMVHVDFLSRYINPAEQGLADRMNVWQIEHEEGVDVIPALDEIIRAQQVEPPVWGKGFASREGKIFYRSKYYVPPSLRYRVVAAGHRINPLIHNGMRKTKAVVNKVFCWPRMERDIANYVQACLGCQRTRPGIETLQGIVKRHDVRGAFEKVYVDIWSTTINAVTHHCLTAIDSLTRWVEIIEIPNCTSAAASTAFFCGWVARFGVPAIVVSDRGPAFMGDVFSQLALKIGTRLVRTTPHHPQGNALIESFHRRLNRGFCLFSQGCADQLSFTEILSLILMGYRSTIHDSLEDSPAYLSFGVDMRPAQEGDWRFVQRVSERERLKNLSLTRLEIMAKFNERAQQLEKAGNVSRDTIEVGDLVLLRLTTQEKYNLRIDQGSIKLQPKWSLPFRVIRVSPNGQSATVRNLVSFKRRELPLRIVHIRDLRFISAPRDAVQRREWDQILSQGQLPDVFDPVQRQDILSTFWEKVENQQPSHKRARTE